MSLMASGNRKDLEDVVRDLLSERYRLDNPFLYGR